MRAGKLRNQIVIEQVTETRSATGAFTRAWATFATVPAEKLETKGREFFSGGGQQNATVVEFMMRPLAGLTTKMRITYLGKIYDIKDIADTSGRRRDLHVSCVEGINRG